MKIKVSACAAIIRDKKVLLIRRAETQEDFPGCWAMPAGGTEEDDASLEVTTIRETKEEVDLTFYPHERLNFYETVRPNKRIIGCVYLGHAEGEPRINSLEVTALRWCTYDEARELELGFKYPEVIEDLHRKNLI